MCAMVENIPFTFLIDTGSNVSILSSDLVQQLSPEFHENVQPTNTKLLSVTGEVTPFLGKANIEMKLGSQHFQHSVFVADIANEGILDMDFLTAHTSDLILSRRVIKINNEEILCFRNSCDAQLRCCRFSVLDHAEIPPATEDVVPGYARGIIDRKAAGFLEADTNFLHTKGLLVGKALVCPLTGTVHVRIANPYNHSCKLYKDFCGLI